MALTWDLPSIWNRRNTLVQINNQKISALGPMPIPVMVWFNVMLAEIIAHWNDDGQHAHVIIGKDLLARVLKVFKTHVNAEEWQKALNTLCLPNIKGAMNFLWFTEDGEHYLVNYPWVCNYMNSELAKQWVPALQMMYGLNLRALREPSGAEAQWVSWLTEIELCRRIQNFSGPPAGPGGPLYQKSPGEMTSVLKRCVELKQQGLL